MDLSTTLMIGALAFVLAGAVKGLAGMGLPTVALGIMTLVVDPRTAIALVLIPMIGSNLWQVLRAGNALETLRKYWLFAVVLMACVSLTAFASAGAGDRFLTGFLGAVILFFVWFSWFGWVPVLPARHDRAAQVVFGLLAGILGGLTASWAAPLGMYLAARQVDRDEFVRATGMLIFLGSLPLAFAYVRLGFATGPLAIGSALMLVPALVGFWAGEIVRNRLSSEGFRKALLIVFAALGTNLIRRAFF